MTLSDNSAQSRYIRHLMLEPISTKGQSKLAVSHVLIIGAGGLGCAVGPYLTAAGVGKITIVDYDRVELSNLQRQILYTNRDIGFPKVDIAGGRLRELNPEVEIVCIDKRVERTDIENIIESSKIDFVVDATDGLVNKFAINDACVNVGVAFCVGAVDGFRGQLMVVKPGGACLRCVFPEPEPETGNILSVFGPAVGMVGCMQAGEVIKHLCSVSGGLENEMLCIDAQRMGFKTLKVAKRPGCVCA